MEIKQDVLASVRNDIEELKEELKMYACEKGKNDYDFDEQLRWFQQMERLNNVSCKMKGLQGEENMTSYLNNLPEMAKGGDRQVPIVKKEYWNSLFKEYVSMWKEEFERLSERDVLDMMLADKGYIDYGFYSNASEYNVDVIEGNICCVDFGKAYKYEVGFLHLGLVIKMHNQKALVIPMSSNLTGKDFEQDNLYKLEVKGMQPSVLFLNDAKFINTARVIHVDRHVDVHSKQYKEIKEKYINLIK